MADLVGIVLVSHSRDLALGLRAVLSQVGGESVPVAAAGGTDDGRIGTSYELIAEAIAAVDHGSGVVVLTDLGSAVLTAKAVLSDRTAEASGSEVVLVDTPFVEGAVAAAVIAATGADLSTVRAAAEEARDVRKL
jgi:PTS hybrid protein